MTDTEADHAAPDADAPKSANADHPSTPDGLAALVERWFFESFHGSVVARTTEVWNHVHAAKDELKRRLAAFAAEL